MNLVTTVVFYLLAGAAVAVASLVRGNRSTAWERIFQAMTAILFWPLYLPMLLQPAPVSADRISKASVHSTSALERELERAIAQVNAELDDALGTLDGWVDTVLAREQSRFGELCAAWRQQAARVGELERLLAQPDFVGGAMTAESSERAAVSEAARRENIRRLQAIRDRLRDDLLGNLARVRELVTMIHLARYTGAPAARAEELVEQIAAAVAGLSEAAAWDDMRLPGCATA